MFAGDSHFPQVQMWSGGLQCGGWRKGSYANVWEDTVVGGGELYQQGRAMSSGWWCEGFGQRAGRAVKGFGRGRLIQILVLCGLRMDGGMGGADSQLGQGTELGFLGPEPEKGTFRAFLGERLSIRG